MTNVSVSKSISKTSDAVTNALRDIKPPIEISNPWIWLWWTLGALALVGLILLIVWLLKKNKANVPVSPLIPAHVRARQKLDEALALLSQPKPFCIAVSDTIRAYLEERFTFRAPERTTEEFLHELASTDLLLPDQKESLGEFLKRCDLVKFARYEPGEPELRELHNSALRLIEETVPLEQTIHGASNNAAQPPPIPAASSIANRKS
jgi:hypothetical protein